MPKALFLGMNLFIRSMVPLIAAGLVATGCDDPRTGASRHHEKAIQEKDGALRPEFFISAPNTFEGCVGLYTYDSLNIAFDSLDVDKGRKILVTRAQDVAFFRIHNQGILLKYDKAESKSLDNGTHKEVYRGNEYTVVLITHSVREEGEAVWSTGTIEIIRGDKRLTIKIRGLSGC